MRIGFFTSIDGWGGSESYLKTLILGVRDAGHAPVLFGIRGTRLFDEIAREGIACVGWKERAGVTGYRLSVIGGRGWEEETAGGTLKGRPKERVLGWLPLWLKLLLGSTREVVHLRKLFRRCRVDVMHVNVHGYEMAGVACRLARIPCLAMNMITPIDEPYWFRRFLIRRSMRLHDHVSSQSKASTEAWVSLAGLDAERCSFVWNGVDLTRFSPGSGHAEGRTSGVFRLISVGRLHTMKGYRHLLEAMALLKNEAVTLEILGDGAQGAELEGLIERLGLRSAVRLRGHVENPEDYLKRADCFVLPSVSHESCPAVLAEAMACGLPVITSDFGPLPELNVEGETGLVVRAGDCEALAGAIRKLAGAPQLCRRMGAAGRERAERFFTRARMIETTLAWYEQLAAR